MDGDAKIQPHKRRIGDNSNESVKCADVIKRHKSKNENVQDIEGNNIPHVPIPNGVSADVAFSSGDRETPSPSILSSGDVSDATTEQHQSLGVVNGSIEDTPDTLPYDLIACEEEAIARETNVKTRNNDHSLTGQSHTDNNITSASVSGKKPCNVTKPRVYNSDVIDLTQTDDDCIGLLKIPAIQRDAEQIASLLNLRDVDAVYQHVLKNRMLANRVEVVTNSILEDGIESMTTNKTIVHPRVINRPTPHEPAAADDEECETFSAIFSDINSVKLVLKKRHPSLNVNPNLIYAELEANFRAPNRVLFVANLITQVQPTHPRQEEDIESEPSAYATNRPSSKNKGSKYKGKGQGLQSKTHESELVDEVDIILKKFPHADENEVYVLLQESCDNENRLEIVIDKLLDKMKTETLSGLRHPKKSQPPSCTESKASVDSEENGNDSAKMSSEEEGLINNDPIYRDTCIISRLFPHRDKNEIYAYLEVHHNKSNRIAIVTEELLRLQEQSQENRPDESTADECDVSETENSTNTGTNAGDNSTVSHQPQNNKEAGTVPTSSTGSAEKEEEEETAATPLHEQLQIPIADEELQPLVRLEQDVDNLRAIFPECDPMWLYEQLAARTSDDNRVQTVSSEMFENRTYPKLKDRLEKEQKHKRKQRLQNLQLNVREFLDMFPDPTAHFSNVESAVSEAYKQHCLTQLRNSFPYASSGYIDHCITSHNGHFLPAFRDLEKTCKQLYSGRQSRVQKKRFRRTARDHESMPEEPDEYFFRELIYVTHEERILDSLKSKEEEKEKRLLEAKENKECMECGCCFDDEVLPEDTLTCPQAHVFCVECVRRSSEEVIGQAKLKFPCLSGNCESEFPLSTLKKAVSAKVFSNLLRKTQEEEIRQADIPDLVACPFCSFATIMENEHDKVFKCQNPECLKESCRLCREPSHIPLRCEEVERQGETSMRTFIENKMSEAMLRECWRCKKRFYKTEGCNKMTCTCGASMCYVCREPIKGYDHFGGPNGCPQDTDVFVLHRQEMERAAHEAKQRYTDEHPEASTTELMHDPLQHLGEAGRGDRDMLGRGRGRGGVQFQHMFPGQFPIYYPFQPPPPGYVPPIPAVPHMPPVTLEERMILQPDGRLVVDPDVQRMRLQQYEYGGVQFIPQLLLGEEESDDSSDDGVYLDSPEIVSSDSDSEQVRDLFNDTEDTDEMLVEDS